MSHAFKTNFSPYTKKSSSHNRSQRIISSENLSKISANKRFRPKNVIFSNKSAPKNNLIRPLKSINHFWLVIIDARRPLHYQHYGHTLRHCADTTLCGINEPTVNHFT